MSSKTYHFSSETPTTLMLEALLKKKDWLKQVDADMDDQILQVPDKIIRNSRVQAQFARFLKQADLEHMAPTQPMRLMMRIMRRF